MRLNAYLLKNDISRREFGRLIGHSHSQVSRWCAGKFRPRPETMHIIAKMTKGAVNLQDWFDRRIK